MEHFEEEIPDNQYHIYQHFITYSRWDHDAINEKTALNTSALYRHTRQKVANSPDLSSMNLPILLST